MVMNGLQLFGVIKLKNKLLISILLILVLIFSFLIPCIKVNAETIDGSDIWGDNNSSSSTTSQSIPMETVEDGIKYYDGIIFDKEVLSNSNIQDANIYKSNRYMPETHSFDNFSKGSSNPYFEYTESLSKDIFESHFLLNTYFKDKIVTYNNFPFNVLKHNINSKETGYVFFSRTITKNIYFSNDTDFIEFYVDHLEDSYNYLLEFNNLLTFTVNIPLLSIDGNVYLGIRFNGKDNGFQLYAKDSVLNIERINSYLGSYDYITKLRIPRVDYFKNITYTYLHNYDLSYITSNSNFDIVLHKTKMLFAFSEEMYGDVNVYPFDILDFNLKDKTISINKWSYSDITINNQKYLASEVQALINDVQFEVIYSQILEESIDADSTCSYYLEKYPGYTCKVKSSKDSNNKTVKTINLRGFYGLYVAFYKSDGTVEKNIISEDDNVITFSLRGSLEIPFEFSNFTYNILSLEISPYTISVNPNYSNSFRSSFDLVNYQKYTASINRTARTFYFDAYAYENVSKTYSHPFQSNDFLLIGEKKTFKQRMNDMGEDVFNWIWDVLNLEDYWVSQNLYFDFYFDEAMTKRIPLVDSISFTYQKGFEEANKNDPNGFYLDSKYNGTSKAVKHKFIEVDPEFKTSNDYTFAWSKDMEIDDTLSLKVHKEVHKEDPEEDIKYRYVIENSYEVEKESQVKNKYLNAFSPIEINYNTEDFESIPLVANSQGLHIVYDENGNAYVFDADGNFRNDYDIFTTESGFKLVAKDSNNDGIIEENETVNSNTGNWEKMPEKPDFPEDKTLGGEIGKFFNGIGDFFGNIWDGIKTIGQGALWVFGILAVITIYVFIIQPLFNWISKLSNKYNNNKSKRKKHKKK